MTGKQQAAAAKAAAARTMRRRRQDQLQRRAAPYARPLRKRINVYIKGVSWTSSLHADDA